MDELRTVVNVLRENINLKDPISNPENYANHCYLRRALKESGAEKSNS